MVSGAGDDNPFSSVVNQDDTYLVAKYKEWCMANPGMVYYEDSSKCSREEFLKKYFETRAEETVLADLFESERRSTLKSDDRAKYDDNFLTIQQKGVK